MEPCRAAAVYMYARVAASARAGATAVGYCVLSNILSVLGIEQLKRSHQQFLCVNAKVYCPS